MFDKDSFSGSFSAAAFVVRLMAYEAGNSVPTPTMFSCNRIDRIRKMNDEISEIILKSGTTFPVLMSYDDLEKKIYFREFRDAPVLDLCDVTGDKLSYLSNMTFIAEVRKANTNQRVVFSFSEAEVKWDKRDGYASDYSKAGRSTKIPLLSKLCPFGGTEVILDIPVGKLEILYSLAKKKCLPVLDLQNWQQLEKEWGLVLPKP